MSAPATPLAEKPSSAPGRPRMMAGSFWLMAVRTGTLFSQSMPNRPNNATPPPARMNRVSPSHRLAGCRIWRTIVK